MQKWEYCAVGPIINKAFRWKDDRANSAYLPGPITERNEAAGWQRYSTMIRYGGEWTLIESSDELDQLIAQLGENGWELVGIGPVTYMESDVAHFLYFKRLKEE